MSDPTFQEWKSKNPTMSLNDYYKKFPPQKIEKSEILINQASQQKYQSVEKPLNQILILVSVAIIISFFLPWLDIKAFNLFDLIKCNGFDLPKVFESYYRDFSDNLLFTIYAIPIGAFLVIVAESMKSWLKFIGQILVIFVSIYWFYLIQQLITYSGNQFEINLNPFDFISYGVYITLLGSVYYAIDLWREIFG